MVLQYRNHPSIILWGVRINESQDSHLLYKETNEIAHSMDPTRQTGGVRFLKKSETFEDVYTFNDFSFNGKTNGLEGKKDVVEDLEIPYLISEFNGHMYPTKSFDSEQHRREQARRHAIVLEEIFKRVDVSGGFGWCMFDYNTHKDFGSGDRICYHGVMTMFRNPKLAASVYASKGVEQPIRSLSPNMSLGQ